MRVALPLLALIGCTENFEPLSVDGDGGNAFAAYSDGQGRRLETFQWGSGTRNQVVDYVFVLDNSVSMNRVTDRVRRSFAQLGTEDFPAEARIAVLNTLPADISNPGNLHPSVKRPSVARYTPGYGRFVSRRSIQEMRNARPELSKRFRHDGCGEDGWFTPGEKNAKGVSCLVAHTQTTRQAFEVEAGLSSLAEFLKSRSGKLTFRPGASVNIIFVSDTHDPGSTRAEALLASRPTGPELVALIERDNPVSSIRFHAIAPATECVESWAPFGPSYFDVAKATGGAIEDMCTTKQYESLLKTTLDVGAQPTRPMLALGADAETIETVTVDGEPTTWTLHESGRALQVDGLNLEDKLAPASQWQAIDVTYQTPQATQNPR